MRYLLLAVALCMVAGCSRHRSAQSACIPPARSSVAWQLLAPDRASIEGRVVGVAAAEPVTGAQIAVAPGPRSVTTGPDGTFSIEVGRPGEYHLEVRREGWEPATGTVWVRHRAGVLVLVTLARTAVILDECGYAVSGGAERE